MKLFLNVITYLVTAIAAILASFPLAAIYQDLSGNDNTFFLHNMFIWSPIIAIVSFIICYFLIKKITIKPILLGTIIGFWFIKVSIFIRDTIDLYILLMPILLVFLSHFLLKKYNNWLHISGFTLGATFGFITSYATVLFIRLVNNSLTSYFNFQHNELMIVIAGTAIFTILGSIIGLKRCKQTQEM
ncbi:hypothetical protein MH117_18030 [Paenibacillus sp. ACRRX]|uniref:hypothetical protein n=1 Tax=Paenibacillus sp. ACRRX TaxID=2918206 RepID=UPI001EF723DC|nr:hypothetical protein [Paenibacillus sp. ACRRX]MCG7409319.1 hypothetical protein [Paenibacillus sp. ACRRX]